MNLYAHECITFSYNKYFCNCKVCAIKSLFINLSSGKDTFWEISCPEDGWSALPENQSYPWWLKLST